MSKTIELLQKYKNKADFEKLGVKFKQKKTQSYTMLVLSLFTISVFGFFAIRPTLVTIASLKRQIEDRREVDQKLSNKINQLVASQAEYDIIEPFIPKIKAAVPERSEYFSLLREFSEVREASEASVSGITIGKVSLSPVKPGNYDVDFKAESSFSGIGDLLGKLLSMRRILTIEKLNIGIGSEEDKRGILQTDIKAKSYYRGEKTNLRQKGI